MILSRLFLLELMKKVDDLHDSWNLHVSVGPVQKEEEETKAAMQYSEIQVETFVGVSKETDLQEIGRQGQATGS